MSNKSQDDAKSILEAAGFKVGNVRTVDNASIEKDKVVSTDPAAHSKQTKGTIITLYISSGMTKIPDNLIGQPKDTVIEQLKQAGLTQITIESEYSDSIASAPSPASSGCWKHGRGRYRGHDLGVYRQAADQRAQRGRHGLCERQEPVGKLRFPGHGFRPGGWHGHRHVTDAGTQSDSGATITLTTKSSSTNNGGNNGNNGGNNGNNGGNGGNTDGGNNTPEGN